MPSPIAHTAVAYLIYRTGRSGTSRASDESGRWKKIGLFLLIAGFSLLPDFDFLPGLLIGDLDAFHNTFTHSLVSGLVVAVLAAVILTWQWPGNGFRWFTIIFVSYELHVVMDYFTLGRGVTLLWPFSNIRYEPPMILFYGLHRSDGLITIRHVWTVLTEGIFAFIVILVAKRLTGPPSDASSEKRARRIESPISSD